MFECNQWILRSGKVPHDPRTGAKCDPHDPAVWVSYAEAQALSVYHGLGLGFVFTASDPYFFIDIDGALGADGTWSTVANQICQQFAGCAIEISQSRRGLHIFGCGSSPGHRIKPTTATGVDLFTELRFVAITLDGWQGDANHPAQGALDVFVAQYYTRSPDEQADVAWTEGPRQGYTGPADDETLVAKMLGARVSVFEGKAGLPDLWYGKEEVLGVCYPDVGGGRSYDHSSADAALCQHLAFWTGADCDRIDRLFRQSALVRGKWTDRSDYRTRTILHAVRNCKNIYNKAPTVPQAPGVAGGTMREGFQFMGVSEQEHHFAGCVYVRDAHRAFVPDGAMLKPEQFKATYGGHLFAMDSVNGKTEKNAWTVFTESQAHSFPKVVAVCFRPELTPGTIVVEGGVSMVNTYVPIETARQVGNVGPFKTHIAKLLPDQGDQQTLLAYMAAVVQYPGEKFQWCPLLQGSEGNGKTLLVNCLAEAIGWKYSHMPNTGDLTNKFNAWVERKLFIGVEEVFASEKMETHEVLKRLVTNSRIEIQAKGGDQYTGDNRANFFMCSNHKDAIRKSRLDRRFAIFFTAQQKPGDLCRDGMSGDYFPNLYGWLRGGGYAVVNDYLRSYVIPDHLNPATSCHRAPDTSSLPEALSVSMGPAEQDVAEAIAEGRPGFRGGWVSSIALGRLFENRRISHRAKREMVEALGYRPAEGLTNGRTGEAIMEEGGRPRIYVNKYCDPKTVLHDYKQAQGYAVTV